MSALTMPPPAGKPNLSEANGESFYEIINGQQVEVPAKSIYAIWVASRLAYRLGPFVEDNLLGQVVIEGLFILDRDKDLHRRPDVAFVSAAKWPLDRPLPETGDWELDPDLAIEVISPNDIFSAVMGKVGEYFEYGVTQVWLVLPNTREVYIYDSATKVRILADKETLEGGALIPGFRLPLANLFQKK
jgi:Uma2 family endonuclease